MGANANDDGKKTAKRALIVAIVVGIFTVSGFTLKDMYRIYLRNKNINIGFKKASAKKFR